MPSETKKKMMIDEFLPLYLKAVDEGVTREEFAKQIGVKVETLYQRVYELRRDVDPTIPLLQPMGKKSVAERAKAILELHRSGQGGEPVAAKPKAKKSEPAAADSEDETEDALTDIFGR